MINLNLGDTPGQHHSVGRDELVFLNNNSEIEVYRIDANLTRLRVVPIVTKEQSRFREITAFPNSPRVAVARFDAGPLIINTENGLIERDFAIPDTFGVMISPDEHWLVLRGSGQVIDLKTDQQFHLVPPLPTKVDLMGMTFVGPNALYVPQYDPDEHQLWDLTTRQLRWSVKEDNKNRLSAASVSDGARIITCSYSGCHVFDATTGRVIHTHGADRTAWSVAIHPNGDYLAGYTRHSFTLQSGLGGAVRVWNAEGKRLVTFAAHRNDKWPHIDWMAVSKSGEYLVTSGQDQVKVWDYHAIVRH